MLDFFQLNFTSFIIVILCIYNVFFNGDFDICSPSSTQKNHSFVEMLKSGKNTQEDEDDEEEEFVIKKEPSSHYKGFTF